MTPAEYMRNRRKARRRKFVLLLGGFCSNCGSKDIDRLQFDHQDPKKKKNDYNDIKDGKESIILKELDKCKLLCPECHLAKTKANKEHINKDKRPSRHGTIWHYKRYRCRCKKCRLAMRLYNLKK